MNNRKRLLCTAVILAVIVSALAGATQAFESCYLIANHHTGQFDAYAMAADGSITFQNRYNLQFQNDPAGVAIWKEFDEFNLVTRAYIFVTGEFSSLVEVIDAITFTNVGSVTTTASELAGIAMDSKNLILYAIERSGNRLFAMDWNPDLLTLTNRAGFPVTLSAVTAAFGLALDSDRGVVYVADIGGGFVRGYDVGTLNQVFAWQPTSAPLDVAVDEERNILYTTHSDGGCASGIPGGSELTCRYDIGASVETTDPACSAAMGAAVNEATGYVYLTHGCNGDSVTVWDMSAAPWTQIQHIPDVGDPAGIAILGGVGIPGDPGITISSNIPDDSCVVDENTATLTVHWFYQDVDTTTLPATDVEVEVLLAPDLEFVSATGGGTYFPGNHSVYWYVGTLNIGESVFEFIETQVALGVSPGEVLTSSAEVLAGSPAEQTDYFETSMSVCQTFCGVALLDVGTVAVGEQGQSSLLIWNGTGGGPITVDVSAGCGLFAVDDTTHALADGESLMVSVYFDPIDCARDSCTVSAGSVYLCDPIVTGVGFIPMQMSGIVDVPDDQGRAVDVAFPASCYDAPGTLFDIVQYEAFRRIDPLPVMMPPEDERQAVDLRIRRARAAGMRSDVAILAAGWDYVDAISADYSSNYVINAPTLGDSTADHGIHWSVFFVRGATDDPFTYFDSEPDSGYSIDNIAPPAPEGFTRAYTQGGGSVLSWDPSVATDFRYFNVYRSENPDLVLYSVIDSTWQRVHSTTDTTWSDAPTEGWRYRYQVTAVDFAGNEGSPCVPVVATGIHGNGVPERFALYQCVPNPFNPTTVIKYDVPPGGGNTTIRIFDVAGRMVRTLVNRHETAGQQTVTWYGRNDHGEQVATGVYFCRMQAPGYTKTLKMILLK